MKKVFVLILTVILSLFSFAGCGNAETETVLRICNCEDYIDESILSVFEEKYNVRIEYSTFGTLENLYNDIIITPDRYDLICPSDYMIEKMAKEGMLQKISFAEDGNYNTYVSPYIKETFENITWNDGQDSLADYAGCYMWGTLGLVYNPEYVDHEDMKSWASLWSEKYRTQSTIKDSIRDSIFMGMAYANKAELDMLSLKLKNGEIDVAAYNGRLSEIFNDTKPESIEKVEQCLKDLKKNIYGFEVDSGKNDVASGKININFAWSGDAVYAMDQAEEQGVELYYSVPEEGSNVWFDGWCVPKSSKQADLAVKFIEFLSDPEIACVNMEYIGYTSGLGGERMFENAIDWYGVSSLVESEITYNEYEALVEEAKNDEEKAAELEEFLETYVILENDKKIYESVYVGDSVTETDEGCFVTVSYYDEESDAVVTEEIEVYKVDLGYFFGEGEYVLYTDTLGRQFSAQYPTEDIINRCVVMNCYHEEANARITLSWERVKGTTLSAAWIIVISIIIVILLAVGIMYRFKVKLFTRKYDNVKKKESKYKVIKVEKLN